MMIHTITHNGNTVRGVADLDEGTPISNVNKFWVFYQTSDNTRSKPLILCYDNGNKWYHRGTKWREATELSSINVPTALSGLSATDKATIKSKLNEMVRQFDFNELKFSKYKTLHWYKI